MENSPFARLPVELRECIYDAALHFSDDDVHIKETNDISNLATTEILTWKRLGLLLVCRQMHHEAIKRLYTVNSFSISQKTAVLPCEEVLEKFVSRIGETNAAKLHAINLTYTLTQGTFGNGQFRRSMRRIGQIAQRYPRCTIRVLLTFLDIYKSIAIRAEMNMQTGVRQPDDSWIEVFEPITTASMEDTTEVQDSMNFLRSQLKDCKLDLDLLRKNGNSAT